MGGGGALHQLPAPWGASAGGSSDSGGWDLSVSGAFPISSYNPGRDICLLFAESFLPSGGARRPSWKQEEGSRALVLIRVPVRASGFITTILSCPRATSQEMSASKNKSATQTTWNGYNVLTVSGDLNGSHLFFSNTPRGRTFPLGVTATPAVGQCVRATYGGGECAGGCGELLGALAVCAQTQLVLTSFTTSSNVRIKGTFVHTCVCIVCVCLYVCTCEQVQVCLHACVCTRRGTCL